MRTRSMTRRARERAESERAQMNSALRAEAEREAAERERIAALRTPVENGQILNLDSIAGPSTASQGKTIIESYEPVFFLGLEFPEQEECLICKHSLNKLCIKCQVSESNREGESCKVCVGQCGHIMHKHCWNDWRNTSNDSSCPLDRMEFVVDQEF